jgi:hypothetical protein
MRQNLELPTRPQFYQQFIRGLLPKNVVCSAVSKFAAYFQKAARERCAHGRLLLYLRQKSA